MNTRFSPPRDKADLLKILIDDGSPFNELRDILFFAAVIGWREGRRVPLAGKGEAIRWDTMNNRLGTEEVMDMIAVAANADDRELLAAERHDERVETLEEFANGGLEVIRERINAAGAVPLRQVFIRMVQDYLTNGETTGDIELTKRILQL